MNYRKVSRRLALRLTRLRRHPGFLLASSLGIVVFGIIGIVLDVASLTSLISGEPKTPAPTNVAVRAAPELSVNYMRSFGSLRTNSLVMAVNEGGFSAPIQYGGDRPLAESGRPICCDLPEFYEKWEHKGVAPLKNELWDTLTDLEPAFDTFFVPLVPRDDPREQRICGEQLLMGADYDTDYGCGSMEEIELGSGFLFAIFENTSEATVNDIEFTFIEADARDNPDFWSTYQTEDLAFFCTNPDAATLQGLGFEEAEILTRKLPFAKPGASFLWPIAGYEVAEDNPYAGALLSKLHLPACLSVVGGPRLPIRAPLRDEAITVELPFGWYFQ